MAYFKINKSGCQEHKGLCEVRYDLFLSRTDEGNEEHYVTVPIFPSAGYNGDVDDMGRPIDLEAYKLWVASLPTETRNNPFCCHFVQFEPNVTDEEILFVGELALDMAMKNWPTRELHKNKNLPCNLLKRDVYELAKAAIGVEGHEHADLANKIVECQGRAAMVQDTDFVMVKDNSGVPYSVRG